MTGVLFLPQSYQRFPVASDTRICLVWLCLSNFQLSPLHNIIAKENVNLLSQQSWMEEVLQEKGIRGIITNSRIMKKVYTQLFLVHSLASPLLLSLQQIPNQFVPQRELLYGSSFRPEYNFLLISRYNSP